MIAFMYFSLHLDMREHTHTHTHMGMHTHACTIYCGEEK